MIRAFQAPWSRAERLALAASLALSAALMWPLRGTLTDDTFVHLRFARALAHGEGLVLNPGERVYAGTSPLWVALIADGMAFGLDGLDVARALGMIATLVSVALFLQLARRTLQSIALRASATLAWSAHAWMLAASTSGLETPLAVALLLAGFVAFTEGRQWGARPVRTSALWGLACLARPELVLLVVLWCAVVIVDAQNREGIRRMVFGILPAAAIYGAWLLFARLYYGTFWPLALSTPSPEAPPWPEALRRQLGVALTTDTALLALLVVALAAAARHGLPRRRGSAQALLPWLWVTLLPALYAARGLPALPRTLLLVLPVLAWLAWRSAERAWAGPDPARPARRLALVGALVAALSVAQNLAVHRTIVVPQAAASTRELERGLIAWGRWFARHAPPRATIAAPEIGALGWFSRRRVLDLTGRASPEMLGVLLEEPRERAVANLSFARFARPEFVVDRAPRARDLERRSPYAAALTPIGVAPIAHRVVGRPRPETYTIYRVDWRRADALLEARGR